MEKYNGYYCYKYPHPAVTTDCLIFGFTGETFKILLIKRKNAPYKDCWAFPGGFMNCDETAEEGALRELTEETGLHHVTLEQLYTFSTVNRDPRERVISVAFLAVVKIANVIGADDAADAKWFSPDSLPCLAFDHEQMLQKAIMRLKEKICLFADDISCFLCDFSIDEREKLAALIRTLHYQHHLSSSSNNHLIQPTGQQRSDHPNRFIVGKERITSEKIAHLAENEIFVFGSNLSGAHGGGAALVALRKFGAVWGQGVGLQGQSYGIPTMHGGIKQIKPYVDEFIHFAADHTEMKFLVTKIGCGIAGFEIEEIAPLFKAAVPLANVALPQEFWDILL